MVVEMVASFGLGLYPLREQVAGHDLACAYLLRHVSPRRVYLQDHALTPVVLISINQYASVNN